MQELIGRLAPLHPEAIETLKVVTYFDALMSAGLGVDALVRAAASMADAVVGVQTGRKLTRFGPDGQRVQDLPLPEQRSGTATSDAEIWIERSGPAHANDAMVLERLAFAVSFAMRRESPTQAALDTVLDASRPAEERAAALERLGLNPTAIVRIVVAPATHARGRSRSTTALTPAGLVAVFLVREGESTDVAPRGLGPLTTADDLEASHRAAQLAYRLTADGTPEVDADDYGLLLFAADDLLRSRREHPDVHTLASLDRDNRRILADLIAASSVRAAAASANMHHSTMQARHESFAAQLGYDPRSPRGRARYELADLMLRLTATVTP